MQQNVAQIINPDIDKANPLVLLISIKLLWLSRNIQWDKELDTQRITKIQE